MDYEQSLPANGIERKDAKKQLESASGNTHSLLYYYNKVKSMPPPIDAKSGRLSENDGIREETLKSQRVSANCATITKNNGSGKTTPKSASSSGSSKIGNDKTVEEHIRDEIARIEKEFICSCLNDYRNLLIHGVLHKKQGQPISAEILKKVHDCLFNNTRALNEWEGKRQQLEEKIHKLCLTNQPGNNNDSDNSVSKPKSKRAKIKK